jgi:hypothetical protein
VTDDDSYEKIVEISSIEPLITILIPLNAELISSELEELDELISLYRILSQTDITV